MQAGESDAVSQHEILKCWRATAGQAKNKVRRQGKKEGSHVSKKSPRDAVKGSHCRTSQTSPTRSY